MRKKAQVWVETVIYLLIGLAIIGVLLSIIKPSIEKRKDEILIEKSIETLNIIEQQIEDIKHYGAGNARTIEINLKKGSLNLNPKEDYIEFSMDSLYMYSELGQKVNKGNIIALTEEKGKGYEVFLKLDYLGKLNLTWNNEEKSQVFQPAPVEQKITMTNNGKKGDFTQIDFS